MASCPQGAACAPTRRACRFKQSPSRPRHRHCNGELFRPQACRAAGSRRRCGRARSRPCRRKGRHASPTTRCLHGSCINFLFFSTLTSTSQEKSSLQSYARSPTRKESTRKLSLPSSQNKLAKSKEQEMKERESSQLQLSFFSATNCPSIVICGYSKIRSLFLPASRSFEIGRLQ